MYQPRRTLSTMHSYTRFLWGKGDLMKKKSEANRGGRPPGPRLSLPSVELLPWLCTLYVDESYRATKRPNLEFGSLFSR